MRAHLLNDAFFDGLTTSMEGFETAETLPPACYVDAGFYEFEKEAVFNHEWLCVGRESWVMTPGDYFTTSIIGEPIPGTAIDIVGVLSQYMRDIPRVGGYQLMPTRIELVSET